MRRFTDYESDDEYFTADAYKVEGFDGVACRVLGWEVESGETEWWDEENQETVYDPEPEPRRTGRVVVRMVGDDGRSVVDESDIKPLAREDYCGECGQIGCGHDGLDRSEGT